MVKLFVAKPWLVCGNHGLTMVTMVFILFVVKPWLIFVNVTVKDSLPWFTFAVVSDSVYSRYLILSNYQVFDTKGDPEKTAQGDSFQNS